MSAMDLDGLSLDLSPDVLAAVDELVELRRDLHAHPELSNQEQRTQRVVRERLDESGIANRPLGGTGVVGLIEGTEPGPVLLLRADMDALPIAEETGLPCCSENDGVMHACGHDAHVAMLLTAARLLARRGLERGTVKLMFQPAEEGGGGAARMIEEGVLDDPAVGSSLAFHVWTMLPIGEVAVTDGPTMASVDGFTLTVHGAGTHAAVPEDGVDPVLITAQIVTAAQSLITRRKSALEPAVLSFTAIRGGAAFNVIPERVEIKGTIRTFAAAVQEQTRAELAELASGIAGSMGGRTELEFFESLAPTVNDPDVAAAIRRTARTVVGDERVGAPPPLMVGEDIGLVQARVPGALALLGCGNPEIGASFPHHHPRFAIDERVLPVGVEIALRYVERELADEATR
jgi:amidohydrolase